MTCMVLMFAFLFSTMLTPSSSYAGSEDSMLSLPAAGPPVDYYYRNYTEIRAILLETVADYPEIAVLYDIGDSWEKTAGIADRDILAIKISDNCRCG